MATTIDTAKYEFIQKRCEYTRGLYGGRNEIMNQMEAIFLGLWNKGKPADPNIVPVVNPDGRNALKGAHRLLKVTTPHVTLPSEKNDPEVKTKSSKLEQAGSALFYANSRLKDIPIENEMTFSALLFGQIYAGINLTKTLKEVIGKSKDDSGQMDRIAEIESRTPALIEVYDPRTCYPIYDSIGQAGFHRMTQMTAFEIVDIYGQAALDALGKKPGEDIDYQQPLNLCEYYDWKLKVAWIDEKKGTPLIYDEHKMAELPIVIRTAGGSRLHKDVKYHVQPFLYDLSELGLFEAQNMAMTMLFDHLYTLGAAALYKHQTPPSRPDKQLVLRWDVKGGHFDIEPGEDVQMMQKPNLDPTVISAIELAERKVTESTIYRTALGESVGSSAPYSMVALLNHAGRLPLVDAQRAAQWAFGDIIEKTFRMIKRQGGGAKVVGEDGYIAIEPADIPKDFVVDVQVEVDLPQDIKMNAQIAASLLAAKLTDKEWVRTKLLGIEQSDEMDKRIMIEELVEMFTQVQIQQTMQQAQAMANPQAAGEMPLPQGFEGMTPEQMMQTMQTGGVPEQIQQQVLERLGKREGASMGNPMTQPMETPQMGGGQEVPGMPSTMIGA